MADVTICVAFQRNGGYLLRQNTGLALPTVVCMTCQFRAHILKHVTLVVIAGKNGSDIPGYKNISDPFK